MRDAGDTPAVVVVDGARVVADAMRLDAVAENHGGDANLQDAIASSLQYAM